MAVVRSSTVIDAPVAKVWAVIRDFGNIRAWIPNVLECRIEGGAPSDQVGCIRAVHMADGMQLRVRLLALSDLDRTQTYAPIPPAGSPLRSIVCTLSARTISEGDRTFAEIEAQVEANPGIDVKPIVAELGAKNYAGMMRGLKSFIETSGAKGSP